MSIFGVFLLHIFPHFDWIRRDTEYFSAFSPNVGRYRPETLRVRTLFTQCLSEGFSVYNLSLCGKSTRIISILFLSMVLLKMKIFFKVQSFEVGRKFQKFAVSVLIRSISNDYKRSMEIHNITISSNITINND